MDQPYSQDEITGQVSLEFDYADTIKSGIWDRFIGGDNIAVLLEGIRGVYKFKLYIPNLLLGEPTRVAGKSGATKLSVSGEVKWNETDDAVQLTLTTEGATNT